LNKVYRFAGGMLAYKRHITIVINGWIDSKTSEARATRLRDYVEVIKLTCG
jgi:hypothetical protein